MRSATSILNDERGSAIVMVLVVILAVAVMFTTALAGTFYRRRLVARAADRVKARYLAEAGIYKRVDELANGAGAGGVSTDLMTVCGDHEVTVTAEPAGGFMRVTSQATHGRSTKTVRALVGQRLPVAWDKAVVIGRSASALVLAGDTRITGDVVVADDGVKPSRVPGHYFKGKKLVDGAVIPVHKPSMPRTETGLVDNFAAAAKAMLADRQSCAVLITGNYTVNAADTIPSVYVEGDIVFTGSVVHTVPVTYCATGAVIIRGDAHVAGPLTAYAYGGITVSGNSRVQNGLLYSTDDITVGGAAAFAGQAVSERVVTVKDRAVVSYPGLLYSRGRVKDGTSGGAVRVLDDATVDGSCVYIPGNPEKYGKTNLVEVAERAVVTGLVYSGTLAYLKGTVNGTVITGTFYYYSSPTSYYNWLKNATIDNAALPHDFAMPFIAAGTAEPEIVDWQEM